MQDTHHLQKGLAKTNQPVLKTRDTITNARKVQVNKNTWIYTTKDLSDEEIINQFNKKYQLPPLEKWK
jgi:hypothetical protein